MREKADKSSGSGGGACVATVSSSASSSSSPSTTCSPKQPRGTGGSGPGDRRAAASSSSASTSHENGSATTSTPAGLAEKSCEALPGRYPAESSSSAGGSPLVSLAPPSSQEMEKTDPSNHRSNEAKDISSPYASSAARSRKGHASHQTHVGGGVSFSASSPSSGTSSGYQSPVPLSSSCSPSPSPSSSSSSCAPSSSSRCAGDTSPREHLTKLPCFRTHITNLLEAESIDELGPYLDLFSYCLLHCMTPGDLPPDACHLLSLALQHLEAEGFTVERLRREQEDVETTRALYHTGGLRSSLLSVSSRHSKSSSTDRTDDTSSVSPSSISSSISSSTYTQPLQHAPQQHQQEAACLDSEDGGATRRGRGSRSNLLDGENHVKKGERDDDTDTRDKGALELLPSSSPSPNTALFPVVEEYAAAGERLLSASSLTKQNSSLSTCSTNTIFLNSQKRKTLSRRTTTGGGGGAGEREEARRDGNPSCCWSSERSLSTFPEHHIGLSHAGGGEEDECWWTSSCDTRSSGCEEPFSEEGEQEGPDDDHHDGEAKETPTLFFNAGHTKKSQETPWLSSRLAEKQSGSRTDERCSSSDCLRGDRDFGGGDASACSPQISDWRRDEGRAKRLGAGLKRLRGGRGGREHGRRTTARKRGRKSTRRKSALLLRIDQLMELDHAKAVCLRQLRWLKKVVPTWAGIPSTRMLRVHLNPMHVYPYTCLYCACGCRSLYVYTCVSVYAHV